MFWPKSESRPERRERKGIRVRETAGDLSVAGANRKASKGYDTERLRKAQQYRKVCSAGSAGSAGLGFRKMISHRDAETRSWVDADISSQRTRCRPDVQHARVGAQPCAEQSRLRSFFAQQDHMQVFNFILDCLDFLNI